MGALFLILLILAVFCLADIVYLIWTICGANGAVITEYLCYIFGFIPLPSLFVGILAHLVEVGFVFWFLGHYII